MTIRAVPEQVRAARVFVARVRGDPRVELGEQVIRVEVTDRCGNDVPGPACRRAR